MAGQFIEYQVVAGEYRATLNSLEQARKFLLPKLCETDTGAPAVNPENRNEKLKGTITAVLIDAPDTEAVEALMKAGRRRPTPGGHVGGQSWTYTALSNVKLSEPEAVKPPVVPVPVPVPVVPKVAGAAVDGKKPSV